MSLIKSISGIRGTLGGKVGKSLTPLDVVKFTAAFGTWLLQKKLNPKIVIGRDARISGESIASLVSNTLIQLGFDIIDLGLSTTPTVEIAVPEEKASGGIIITASHNPLQWNALKLLNEKGEFISDKEGKQLLQIAEKEDFHFTEAKKFGTYSSNNTYITKHIDKILALPLVDKKAIESKEFKIIVDCINSTGAIAIPQLLESLGVKHIVLLNDQPNGLFAHNPEPLPENIRDISREIKKGQYHLGIVVDPDVDRLAFVCEDGEPFGEEYSLVAIADYVLSQKTGNAVSNLSSTRALKDIVVKRGGQYAASAVGEVNVVEMMKQQNAIIGGEGNGGIIYPKLHYGRDALVGIALFLTHLAKSNKSVSILRKSYPNYFISKNKIDLSDDINLDQILEKIKEKYANQPINTIDGVKIEFDDEWVHLRKSNTEPIIRIYSESSSLATAEHLAQKIMMDIKDIISVNA